MTASPAGACPFLLPPLWSVFWLFPRAYSTRICRPRCSDPFSSRALLKEAFEENFTKANPLGLPSGLEIILTLVTFPQGANKSRTSPSKALNERPCTATSNSPCSSSSSCSSTTGCFTVFLTSTEAFLLGAGFYYYSDSLFYIFLGAGFFFGWGASSSDSSLYSTGFLATFFCSTFGIYFEPFRTGLGFYSDSSSSSATILVAFLAIYFDAFLTGFGFSSDSSSSDSTAGFAGFLATTGALAAGFFGGSSEDYSDSSFLACFAFLISFLSLTWTIGAAIFFLISLTSSD